MSCALVESDRRLSDKEFDWTLLRLLGPQNPAIMFSDRHPDSASKGLLGAQLHDPNISVILDGPLSLQTLRNLPFWIVAACIILAIISGFNWSCFGISPPQATGPGRNAIITARLKENIVARCHIKPRSANGGKLSIGNNSD